MKTDIKKIDQENEFMTDRFDYMSNSATVRECTGLIPGNPIPGDFMETYQDVYHYEPTKITSKEE